MEIKMTERDRKLLIFLGIFLLVVGVGYFGVLPSRRKALELKESAETVEATRIETEDQLMTLPAVRELNAMLLDRMAEESAVFYPKMATKDVDKLLTELVLSNGIEARNLSIENQVAYDVTAYTHSEFDTTPYQYTGGAPEPVDDSLENDELLTGESTDDSLLAVTSGAITVDPRCVFVYDVTLDVSGVKEKLQAFIDLLSDDEKYPAIDITGYTWGTIDTTQIVDNQVVVTSEDVLSISLQIYTCDYLGDR